MRRLILALAVLLACAAGTPAGAQSDQQRARAAVQAGQARPLQDILPQLRDSYPGRVLDADLDQAGGRWVYRIKLLTDDGKVLALVVDARSGEVLRVRGGGG